MNVSQPWLVFNKTPVDTAGLNVVTNGRSFPLVLAFCLRTDCLPELLTSDSVLLVRCLG